MTEWEKIIALIDQLNRGMAGVIKTANDLNYLLAKEMVRTSITSQKPH